MAYLNINPDLFLEVAELQRLKQFLDDQGFRKNILDNSVSFGLVKNKYTDPDFNNARVERDLDTLLGQKTIKVRPIFGVDNTGQFLYSDEQGAIPVPNDGNWYWVKIAHAISNIEKGTFTISANGDLVDTSDNAELTKILRGFPNFPARIAFSNSAYNTLQYDVLEVIDDQHATIQHPATNSNGISQFTAEDSLKIKVVGTFTPGITVPTESQFIFEYDSVTISLIQENFTNTPPLPQVTDIEFYIARIKVSGGTVVIQDKRNQYWETKGSELPLEIERGMNALIGIESVQYNNSFSPGDENIVQVGWGMRSSDWSIDTSNNIVTFNSGKGGKFKSVADFSDGNFDGWRLYVPSGKYFKILNSVQQGSAINLGLDTLNINEFSTDGGTTFISGTLLAVPDCDSVEILFTPNPSDNESTLTKSFVFPVNDQTGRCDVLVYKDPSVLYNVKYRYKAHKEYTAYISIPTDIAAGYLTEASFDGTDNLRPSDDWVRYPYSSDPANGFIQLMLSPNSEKKFREKVDKGDIIGVTVLNDISALAEYDLNVGNTDDYIYINGTPTLGQDVNFVLNRTGAISGNEFRVHFNCTALNLNGHVINFVEDSVGGVSVKQMTQAEVYQMLNQEGGIVFTFKYDGTDWHVYQNFDLGRPNEFVYIDGTIASQFDTTGMGKVRGLFGHALCDSRNGTPDLRRLWIVGADPSSPDYVEGATGGEEKHISTLEETAPHDHDEQVFTAVNGGGRGPVGFNLTHPEGTLDDFGPSGFQTGSRGGDPATIVGSNPPTQAAPHENRPPYYAAIICKKLY